MPECSTPALFLRSGHHDPTFFKGGALHKLHTPVRLNGSSCQLQQIARAAHSSVQKHRSSAPLILTETCWSTCKTRVHAHVPPHGSPRIVQTVRAFVRHLEACLSKATYLRGPTFLDACPRPLWHGLLLLLVPFSLPLLHGLLLLPLLLLCIIFLLSRNEILKWAEEDGIDGRKQKRDVSG